ncbi:MAG: hypothetical protein JWN07_1135 [Hyphomicrobiales bacterium]|nr:hypothetical protein [Hyphomicrobiales bacterium]
MNVYTVHLKGSPDDLASLERTVFVREGFSWAALVFGPLWLLWNRLWLALLVWLLAEGALLVWIVLAEPAHSALAGLLALMHLALAFEAAPLRRAALTRRRFRTVTVVQGRRMGDAERAFFASLGGHDRVATPEPSIAARSRSAEMVGLFPSAGA